MSAESKSCPACQARNPRQAIACVRCGASLSGLVVREPGEITDRFPAYDFRYAETDLAEDSLAFRGRVLGIACSILMALLGLLALAFLVLPRLQAEPETAVSQPVAISTRQLGPSVTPGPPTATFTPSPTATIPPTPAPSPAPCVQQVNPGDSLIAIIGRCGYTSLEIMPTVQALNGIEDESHIQIGQQIVMPRPSPTLDPNVMATPESAAASADEDRLALLAFDPNAPTLTPTLLPGLMWHLVQVDENMIAIAARYDTDAKALSDLNPEIPFQLCDFGLRYGGPECTVQLFQGQQMRVPAPTATPTLAPSPSGSETPTPLPTATFNAPIALSPADNAFFSPTERITLRWLGTGALAPAEIYRITLTDLESGAVYTADTEELFLLVPGDWQALLNESRVYEWHVSVYDRESDRAARISQARRFMWQGAS